MRSVKQDLKFRTAAGFHNGQPFTCSQPTVTAGVNPCRLHFIGKPNRIHLQRIFSFVTSQTRTHTYHPRNHPRVFLSSSALSLSLSNDGNDARLHQCAQSKLLTSSVRLLFNERVLFGKLLMTDYT